MRTEERMLILPALYVIYLYGEATTKDLIKELTVFFSPTGEDATILANRNDTKFSQKVRNLKSHRSNNNMDRYTTYIDGVYKLTTEGEKCLAPHIPEFEYLFSQQFSYSDIKKLTKRLSNTSKKTIVYEEIVQEGNTKNKSITVRERSKKLRDAAVQYYSNNGGLRCSVCGFSFEEKYGDIGKGFIEIHHEKPIYQYDEEGVESVILSAIQHLKPLCANCHRMIHRNSKKPLSIRELSREIKKHSS